MVRNLVAFACLGLVATMTANAVKVGSLEFDECNAAQTSCVKGGQRWSRVGADQWIRNYRDSSVSNRVWMEFTGAGESSRAGADINCQDRTYRTVSYSNYTRPFLLGEPRPSSAAASGAKPERIDPDSFIGAMAAKICGKK